MNINSGWWVAQNVIIQQGCRAYGEIKWWELQQLIDQLGLFVEGKKLKSAGAMVVLCSVSATPCGCINTAFNQWEATVQKWTTASNGPGWITSKSR